MKCKVFKINLNEETGNFEEAKFNKFLESVKVNQTFASVINNEFWSILVFYDETEISAAFQSEASMPVQTVKHTASKADESVKPTQEQVILTPEQELRFNNLKQWRNERAAQDGLPPYMIAQNDSLMQIAVSNVKTPEDLISIKGFGEKRAQKYGEQIIQILSDKTVV